MTRRAVLFFAATAAALAMAVSPAWAATFVVNSTGDDGDAAPAGVCNTAPFPVGTEPECTLRAAIQETNANNNPSEVDRIDFSIGGSGVATIFPGSSLPTITQPVDINGYSAPGASANTTPVGDNAELRVRIDGTNIPGIPDGLRISGANSVVRGLSITRFGDSGVEVFGLAADNNTIRGNFVGMTPGGKDRGNGKGVVIASGASDNTVGGTTRQARNIISGNGPSDFFGSSGVDIFGNAAPQPTTGNVVQGNYIGTTRSGTSKLANTGRGVIVYDGASDTTIGDDNLADGASGANIIAFNGLDGVTILGNPNPAINSTGNNILSNSIFSNARLGIDLEGNGVTRNDGPGDSDMGANNLQNFPFLASAKTGLRNTTITGTLRSIQAEGYTLQFFKNPESTKDEGKTLIGEKFVSDANGDGIISFTFRPRQRVGAGNFITATATHDDDTSEFSAPKKVLRR